MPEEIVRTHRMLPELYVTGYEPTLAEKLVFEASEERLTVFEAKSIELGISIAVGLAMKSRSNRG